MDQLWYNKIIGPIQTLETASMYEPKTDSERETINSTINSAISEIESLVMEKVELNDDHPPAL